MGETSSGKDRPGFCVIMAGGRGTRFWPLSRSARPKQLLPLASARSLLRDTFTRVEALVGADRIIVVTSEAMASDTARELPELPPGHIIAEPCGRNTAPCAALGIGVAERLGGRVPVALLPADHLIPDADRFREQLGHAFTHVQGGGEPVTFGILPTHPETGYGYLEVAPGLNAGSSAPAAETAAADFLSGIRFVEKPDLPTAEGYLAAGNYFWNAGIFVWDSRAFDRALRQHLPEVAGATDRALAAYGDAEFATALAAAYADCPAVSIDKGVMEKLTTFRVVQASFRWSDLGSWDVWGSHAAHLGDGNRGSTRLYAVTSKGNVVYAPTKTVALVGVADLIVVDTEDALLVCHADDAQRIREVTEKLREQGREDLL